MDGETKTGMQCAQWEALLSEAIDGTLHGAALASFEAHQQSCPTCRAMREEAIAGMHWLKALEEAEPPHNLVHNILAQTIGLLPSENRIPSPKGVGWWARVKERAAPIFSPVVTPRFAMSFGMAFFSITMLLSIAGFHFSDLRNVDLSSKAITRAYYSTEARVIRYYENIRLVYEIESRVRDLRRAATPPADTKQEEAAPSQNPPAQKSPEKAPPKSELRKQQDRRNQNSSLESGIPALAVCPGCNADVVMNQARLNRRNS